MRLLTLHSLKQQTYQPGSSWCHNPTRAVLGCPQAFKKGMVALHSYILHSGAQHRLELSLQRFTIPLVARDFR